METTILNNKKLCECGCGNQVSEGKRFVNHHNFQQRGNKHPRWEGGKFKITTGYIWQYLPEHHFANSMGYVPEHRLIYEKYYKCCLLSWTEIHHTNEIRDDNRIENLKPMTKHQHMALHRTLDMSDRICNTCGSKTTAIRNDTGRAMWYNKEGGWLCRKCWLRDYNKTYKFRRRKKRM